MRKVLLALLCFALLSTLLLTHAARADSQSLKLEEVNIPGLHFLADFGLRGSILLDAEEPALLQQAEAKGVSLPLKVELGGSLSLALDNLQPDAQHNNRVNVKPLNASFMAQALQHEVKATIDADGINLNLDDETNQFSPWDLDQSGMLGIIYNFLFHDGLTLVINKRGQLLALEVPMAGRQDLSALGAPALPDLALPMAALMLKQRYEKRLTLPLGNSPGAPILPLEVSFVFNGLDTYHGDPVAKLHTTFIVGPIFDLDASQLKRLRAGDEALSLLPDVSKLAQAESKADVTFSKLYLKIEGDSLYCLKHKQFVKEDGLLTAICRLKVRSKQPGELPVAHVGLRSQLHYAYKLTPVDQ